MRFFGEDEEDGDFFALYDLISSLTVSAPIIPLSPCASRCSTAEKRVSALAVTRDDAHVVAADKAGDLYTCVAALLPLNLSNAFSTPIPSPPTPIPSYFHPLALQFITFADA